MKIIPLNINTDLITKKVLDMKSNWISRSNDFPFYTLGRCAYLDGKTDLYYKDLAFENDILIQEFSELYKIVLEALKNLFNEEVYLTTKLRVLGFHIFPTSKKFLSIAGKWHCDYPHTTLGLEEIDPHAFTLAIKLPKSGAGMDYVNQFKQQKHLPYNEKDLVVHNGKTIHRISGIKNYIPDEHRITLQGHVIRREGLLETFF
tara:strand:+ start:1292 stop:1900 length:609 start_codon:yes stop_codon:yes gene_type:complete